MNNLLGTYLIPDFLLLAFAKNRRVATFLDEVIPAKLSDGIQPSCRVTLPQDISPTICILHRRTYTLSLGKSKLLRSQSPARRRSSNPTQPKRNQPAMSRSSRGKRKSEENELETGSEPQEDEGPAYTNTSWMPRCASLTCCQLAASRAASARQSAPENSHALSASGSVRTFENGAFVAAQFR